MADRVLARRPVVTVTDGADRHRRDTLAVEEPMEVRVNGDPVSVTMRTPGDDFELALGFCLTEGIVADPRAVEAMRYCEPGPGPHQGEFNIVDVRLRTPERVAEGLRRNVYTTSSCGMCGTASIDAVRKQAAPVHDDAVRVDPATLVALPDRVRVAQRVFERTGGLHAAAVTTADGTLRCVREDVGRHNAVDKVIGWAATAGALPLAGHVLFVSGRVAFEIAQKALIAGIPVIAAVSAPSSLAVDLATEAGMTLVGFLRGARMNVYAGPQRLGLDG
ncbi:MAG: formate dehydrogenase accessory sulfurtransferase FdhD [Egibacteraceae bacterium]